MHIVYYAESFSLSVERIVNEAKFILLNDSTIRETALAFGVSKSTVHKDFSVRLFFIDTLLYYKVKDLLNKNLKERHLRGGNATRIKYQKQSMLKELEKRIKNYPPS